MTKAPTLAQLSKGQDDNTNNDTKKTLDKEYKVQHYSQHERPPLGKHLYATLSLRGLTDAPLSHL